MGLNLLVYRLKVKGISAFQAHEEVHLDFYKQLRVQLDRKEIEIFEMVIEKLTEML